MNGAASSHAAAEAAARHAYGRLLAWLAWQWRDLAAAEDALAEAFATALARWPRDGVPDSPEGWLLTAAKRHLLQQARRRRLAEDPALTILFPAESDAAPEPTALPDDRLRLLFVCAHPAIDAPLRTALMLQTVLGIDAARIAQAFLVGAEAMGKRLVRVKAKIKAAGIRFEEPGVDELPERLHAVLEAVYAAWTLHWGDAQAERGSELADEALYLAELVAARLPDEPEALGLLALLRLARSRVAAGRDAAGRFVPLDRQDPARWDGAAIASANELLASAVRHRRPGPFQLEAAIQAAHASRRETGVTPWPAIVVLYERLLALAPTVGAAIGHAVALAQARGDARAGLARLDAVVPAPLSHQPYWAARAHLLAAAGDAAGAADATARAVRLTAEPSLRAHLEAQLAELRGRL